jgi:predicted  nucleic acid-binding Zn-ribbon protein
MVGQDVPMGGQSGQSEFGQEIADAQTQSQQDGQGNEYSQIAGLISDLDRRLRVLEERYGNLRKKLQLTDQNLIEADRAFGKELRGFNDEQLEMKRSIVDFEEKISIFSGEMDNTAKKTDLKVLEKYLMMWDPRMFVTRKELREYLKSKSAPVDEDDAPASDE